MNKRSYGKGHLKFLIAAMVIMVLTDRFVFDGTRPYIEDARQDVRAQVVYQQDTMAAPVIPASMPTPAPAAPPPDMEEKSFNLTPQEHFGPVRLPPWQRNAVKADIPTGRAKIVVVIDDLGVSRAHSKEVLALPGPLTLAFLPYASHVDDLVKQGRHNGHEIMVHMPMEPMDGAIDTGDIVLRTGQTPEEFAAMLEKGLSAFDGYVGLNNHMGSRLTQDGAAMARLMDELHKRGLLFLDSRTIQSSVAAETAAAHDVPYAVRDVFLDHDPAPEAVRESLLTVESIAKKRGLAIAIGHPKPDTIQALKEWLPTLADKGFILVPVSAVVVNSQDSAVSSAPAPAQAPQP